MRLRWFVVLALLVLGLDQGSKAWARTLPPGPQPVIAGYWDWELSANPGVAFSALTDAPGGRILLSLLALAAAAAIVVVAVRSPAARGGRRAALALLLGGAVGNLVDRVHAGAVTDFVRWRIGEHRWPIFNLADAALLIGVVVLRAEGLRADRAARPAARAT
jgi:signal peptidase II